MSITRNIINAVRIGYRRMFQRQEDTRTRAVVEVLKQMPLFQGLAWGVMWELAEVLHPRRYKRDEFIYYEHDPGIGLYIVQQGTVRLLAEDENGNVHELRQVGDNDFFGALSLMGDFRRMETAQATTETHVLGLFSPDLKTLLKRNPSVGAAVMAALAKHLAEQQVELVQRLAKNEGAISARRLLRGTARRDA